TDDQDEGDAIGCLYTLNHLRTLDGDNQQNWTTFKRLFLNDDETSWLSSPWGEQVANCSVSEFADSLSSLGTMLKNMQDIMEKPDFDGIITTNISQNEFTGAQNILNDLIQPSNMVHNGLMTSWLPMSTCSHFNALPMGMSPNVRSSFQHRSVLADHPTGPMNNVLQGRSLPSAIDSSTRQTFNQYSKRASDTFLNLLRAAPNYDITLNDLVKYYDRPQSTAQSSIPKQIVSHAMNTSSVNKENFTLIFFDPNFGIKNITDEMYRTINDYILFYADKSQLLSYVQSINEEKIFIIIFDPSLDMNFLSQLQNLNQINSIFIYCLKQDNYEWLMNNYSKISGIYTDKTLLLEQVRTTIAQQSTLTFGFNDPQQIFTTYTKLSRENALFLWNVLLKDLLMKDQSTDKSSMIQKCTEYYCRNTTEMENIEQFEKTYESANANEWYSKRCFVSKLLNKAFHTADTKQLKLFNFFIHDLCSNIKSCSSVEKLYCTTIVATNQFEMLLKNVDKLITLVVVNVCTPYVYSNNTNEVIFDMGTTFQFSSFDFDDNLKLWIARLTATNDGTQISQNYIIAKQQTMERMTLSIIMGELLLTIGDLSKTKTYFENLQNEDDALIYYYYGRIHYLKGEYELALENLQIAYELMITEERLKDSAFVLHDIGYVYDMKKEFNEALDSHRKALNIRQTHYSAKDVQIGVSLYNIGRTLVNMDDDSEGLIYHQKALNIWEQTLTYNHPYMVQSLHSHGAVYFNKRDYSQALHYYTRALKLYEMSVPRDNHGILMVKNALEKINDLSSRQLMTR
ncbi:unnamed protein product, partial [Didymodactylos carnosus]